MRRVLGFTLLALLVDSPRAEACSVAPCSGPPLFAPRHESTVPANVSGLFVYPDSWIGAASSVPDGGIALVEVDGGSVTIALEPRSGGFMVIPMQPLVEGRRYELKSRSLCQDADEFMYAAPFNVEAARPADGGFAGNVSRDGPQVREHHVPNSGASCRDTHAPAGFVDFTLVPSTALAPFLPVASFALEVDGVVVTSTVFGAPANTKLSVHSVCDQSSNYPVKGLAPGTHSARIVVSTPGSTTTWSSNPTEFEIGCSAQPIDGCGCGAENMPLLPLALAALRRISRRRSPQP